MPARRLHSLVLALALAATACHPGAAPATGVRAPRVMKPGNTVPGVISDNGAGIVGDAGASIIGDAGASLIGNNGGSLIGKAKIPTGIVSNNSGSLVSDQGGAIVGDAGASLIGDAGASLIGKTKWGLLALAEAPLKGFHVTLVDAGGTPFKDASGKLFQATTDAQGNFSFPRTPRGANLVLRVDLPTAVGPMLAFVPDAAAGVKRNVDVDGVSTLVMGYVLSQYVATQASPRQVLAKLPAAVEADTRKAAATAEGDTFAATRFTNVVVTAAVSALRAKDSGFDTQMDYVRSLLVAGLSDLGDGQDATKVALQYPDGLARLPDGSLLIAERNEHRVRRRWPDGHLTTFAGKAGGGALGDGGPAVNAFVDRPMGLAVDAQGNAYIADNGTQRVRRVDAKTGVIQTVMGSGGDPDAQTGPLDGLNALKLAINHPTAIAIDAQNRVVVLANNGTFRLEADGTVKSINYDTHNGPEALATGPDGKVYGFQHDPGQFFALDDTTMNPVASVPLQKGDDGAWFTVAPDGSFYVADGDKLSHADPKGWTDIPFNTAHDTFRGLVYDGDHLDVADSGRNRVFSVPVAGGDATLIAGLPPQNGDVPVRADALGLNRPTALALDSAGNLYVADGLNGVVWKRRTDGLYVRFAGLPEAPKGTPDGEGGLATKAPMGKVAGLTVRPDGTVVIVDGDVHTGIHLREVGHDGILHTQPIPAGMLFPAFLGLDTGGNVLVGDVLVEQVFRLGKDGSATPLAPDGLLSAPTGVTAGPDGAVYVADLDAAAVYRLSRGTSTTVVGGNGAGFGGDGGPATAAKLSYPLGLALDDQGRLYVADSHNNRVRRVDFKTGIVQTVVGEGSRTLAGTAPDDSLQEPIGLAFDADGNLYVADSGHNQVKLVARDALAP